MLRAPLGCVGLSKERGGKNYKSCMQREVQHAVRRGSQGGENKEITIRVKR
jgi:hypothetical protein